MELASKEAIDFDVEVDLDVKVEGVPDESHINGAPLLMAWLPAAFHTVNPPPGVALTRP